jgi:hypothetical protein
MKYFTFLCVFLSLKHYVCCGIRFITPQLLVCRPQSTLCCMYSIGLQTMYAAAFVSLSGA